MGLPDGWSKALISLKTAPGARSSGTQRHLSDLLEVSWQVSGRGTVGSFFYCAGVNFPCLKRILYSVASFFAPF